MRIALINPPSLAAYGKIRSGHHCSFPLGLGYIAAYVRQFNHQVIILDPEAARISEEAMWAQIEAFKPDLIGFTAVTSNFMQARDLIRQAKEQFGSLVVIGGPHATALPQTTIESCVGLDAVIRGEGELPILEIARQFDETGKVDFDKVAGAAFYVDGKLQKNLKAPLIESIDDLPPPARDLVDLSWYSLHPHFQRGKMSATVLSSRGCPSRCTFCGNLCTGRIFRPASGVRFVDELETLVREYGIRHFHIVDDCFTAEPARVNAICNMIIERRLDITWFIFGRVDTLLDEALVLKMRAAGCVFVLLGIETGNQEVLDLMKKDTTIEQAMKCCETLRKCGIRYFNSFIIGNTGDTEQTVAETVDLAVRLKSTMAGFNIMIPFPGAPIFAKYYRHLDDVGTDWNNFCSVGDDVPYEPVHTSLTRQQLLKLTADAYRTYYSRPSQLWRVLMFARSPRVLIAYLRGAAALLSATVSWRKKSKQA